MGYSADILSQLISHRCYEFPTLQHVFKKSILDLDYKQEGFMRSPLNKIIILILQLVNVMKK